MNNNLYIGNLPYKMLEGDELAAKLEALFAEMGPVTEMRIIKDQQRNDQNRGFGFVTMANASDAEKAIAKLNGYEFEARTLRVSPADNKDQGSKGKGKSGWRDRDQDAFSSSSWSSR